uniref:Uncharacterized protein n=1 Tax=mine drainage metagenome TaxID=410659 RepID=E6PQP1_9ZZZZ
MVSPPFDRSQILLNIYEQDSLLALVKNCPILKDSWIFSVTTPDHSFMLQLLVGCPQRTE